MKLKKQHFLLLVAVPQRVARVLWNQLDTERREQHISCVELFYRLHCLAPSASICEDIICQALLHKDKVCRKSCTHAENILLLSQHVSLYLARINTATWSCDKPNVFLVSVGPRLPGWRHYTALQFCGT